MLTWSTRFATVHPSVTTRVLQKESGEVIGKSRANRMSKKWASPTKLQVCPSVSKKATVAPSTKGTMTRSVIAAKAGTIQGRTHNHGRSGVRRAAR